VSDTLAGYVHGQAGFQSIIVSSGLACKFSTTETDQRKSSVIWKFWVSLPAISIWNLSDYLRFFCERGRYTAKDEGVVTADEVLSSSPKTGDHAAILAMAAPKDFSE